MPHVSGKLTFFHVNIGANPDKRLMGREQNLESDKLEVECQVCFRELKSQAEQTFPHLHDDEDNSYLVIFIRTNQDY